jgi:hypothetical protein
LNFAVHRHTQHVAEPELEHLGDPRNAIDPPPVCRVRL